MKTRLSICIPTYNRAAFIGETLKSIITQATNDVEIVISDNASDDNTEQIICEFQKHFPRITYFRWDKNMGADRNFLKVIEIANGDYCWFMGSDDRVEHGGLSHILSQLENHAGLTGVSVNQAFYSPDMTAEIKGAPVAGGKLAADCIFSDANTCFSLLGLYFGYISGQIVNRSAWNKVIATERLDPYLNAFVHIYVIGRMLKHSTNWLYIHRKCVGYRSGNDSFLQEGGLYKRQVIAHASFEKIVRDLFGKASVVYNSALYMALSGYIRGDVASFKVNNISYELQLKLLVLYSRFYWRFPYFWINVVPLFLMPNAVVTVLRRLYRAKLKHAS